MSVTEFIANLFLGNMYWKFRNRRFNVLRDVIARRRVEVTPCGVPSGLYAVI
jgi:hypothetical protein